MNTDKVEILIFKPGSVEIWRNGKNSESGTFFPTPYPWEKVIAEGIQLAMDYSDPQTGTPAPLFLAERVTTTSGNVATSKVERREKIPTGPNPPAKRFRVQTNIGKCKYIVSSHDGIQTHPDGSEFWGCAIFSNKKKLAAYLLTLQHAGYIEI